MSGFLLLAFVFVSIPKKQLSLEFVEQQLLHFFYLFSWFFLLLHPLSFLLVVNIPLSIGTLMEGLLEQIVNSGLKNGQGILVLILNDLIIVLLILFIGCFLVLLRIFLEKVLSLLLDLKDLLR